MRIHEFAKKISKDSKEVIAILAANGIEGKKTMSSISEDEMNLVLEKSHTDKNENKSEKKQEKEEPPKNRYNHNRKKEGNKTTENNKNMENKTADNKNMENKSTENKNVKVDNKNKITLFDFVIAYLNKESTRINISPKRRSPHPRYAENKRNKNIHGFSYMWEVIRFKSEESGVYTIVHEHFSISLNLY